MPLWTETRGKFGLHIYYLVMCKRSLYFLWPTLAYEYILHDAAYEYILCDVT